MKRMATVGAAAMILGLAALVAQTALHAGEKVELKVGDKAPTFVSVDEAGKPWKSSEHVGKKVVVVYFYPADFTGGCTKQACGFRDDVKDLEGLNVEVVGISGDTPETHAKFKKFHKLPFTLLADEKGEVAMKFGVPVKVAKGVAKAKIDDQDVVFERGATIQRWTFVIDQKGNIAYKNSKVNAAEDSKKIIEVVKGLSK